jgi:hypothetical protein
MKPAAHRFRGSRMPGVGLEQIGLDERRAHVNRFGGGEQGPDP